MLCNLQRHDGAALRTVSQSQASFQYSSAEHGNVQKATIFRRAAKEFPYYNRLLALIDTLLR